MAARLPQGTFQLTHHWARNYDPEELVTEICSTGIEFLLSRSSLVSLVTLCEAALKRFNQRLSSLNNCREITGQKKLLAWAFTLVTDSAPSLGQIGERLPATCGDLDNARRLRNCIVHNNGGYDEKYLSDCVDVDWVKRQQESGVATGEKIFLTSERFEYFSRSHVEFLHVLHNSIQDTFFGHKNGYSYAEEGKTIEWHRVLSGRRIVEM